MIRQYPASAQCLLVGLAAMAAMPNRAVGQFELDPTRWSAVGHVAGAASPAAGQPAASQEFAPDVTRFSLSLADVEEPSGATRDPQEGDAHGGTETASSDSELAKKTQNPVADLISVPFQNNINFGVGHDNDVLWVMNFQPVIPINLNERWNLINRVILPVIYAPEFVPGQGDDFGLGDLQYTAFLSPRKEQGLIWGVGPVFKFPTATDTRLGSRQWSMGPSAVVLAINGPWVIGGLVQQIWSVAGDSDRENVSAFLVQPFINYNFESGWYLTTSPIITANWKADSSEQWTVPLGGGIGKVVRIGNLPVNLQVQGFYNVEAPDEAGDWSLRVQFALLFPKE